MATSTPRPMDAQQHQDRASAAIRSRIAMCLPCLYRFFRSRIRAGVRKTFSIISPFVAQNATGRNYQFVSLFWILVIVLSGLTLAIVSHTEVKSSIARHSIAHHYQYAFALLVLVECIYWTWAMLCRQHLRPNWTVIKWRLSQDFGGFICCSELPEYKRDHVQNHLLYGSSFAAIVVSGNLLWNLLRTILFYTCEGNDLRDSSNIAHALVGDTMYTIALLLHTWLQLAVAFYHRKGSLHASCHKLSFVMWLIGLNFVIYIQITMIEAVQSAEYIAQSNQERSEDAVHHITLAACGSSPQAKRIYAQMETQHHEWIRPLGYALCVELVLTLNTVFFSLWYHARRRKRSISMHDECLQTMAVEDAESSDEVTEADEDEEEEDDLRLFISNHHRYNSTTAYELKSMLKNGDLVVSNGYAMRRISEPYLSRSHNSMPLIRENVSDLLEVLPEMESVDETTNLNGDIDPPSDVLLPAVTKSVRITEDPQRKKHKPSAQFSLRAQRRASIKIMKNPRNIPYEGIGLGLVLGLPMFTVSVWAYLKSSELHWTPLKTQVKNETLFILSDDLMHYALTYECVTMLTHVLSCTLCITTLFMLNHLRPSKQLQLHEKIDLILLLITLFGMITLASFALIGMVYPWRLPVSRESQVNTLKGVLSIEIIVGACEAFLQTMLIAKGFGTQSTRYDNASANERVQFFGCDISTRRLGKLITELAMTLMVYNLFMWVINAFYERRHHSFLHFAATNFYPDDVWFAMTEITYPMSICFYFHATVCFTAIINKFASPW